MKAVVLIPTYNEADNVATIVRRVRGVVSDATVCVIDDGSPDGTADLAEAVGREVGQVEVLRRTVKAGLGPAYVAGFRWAIERGYDVAVEMDADGSHDPASIPTLLHLIDEGADLALGSRWVPGGEIPNWEWYRRLLSQWGNAYAGRVLHLPVRDATGGFRAFRVELLERLDLDRIGANGYGFQVEMAYRSVQAGARVVETPIVFRDRTLGVSKMSWTIVFEALLLVTRWAIVDRVIRRRAVVATAPHGGGSHAD